MKYLKPKYEVALKILLERLGLGADTIETLMEFVDEFMGTQKDKEKYDIH